MAKYYRVRTQEQWDWLMQWFENENKNIKWVNGSENPSNSKIRDNIIGNNAITNVGLYIKLDVYNLISYGYDTEMHTHDYIEVSQMMEDDKMEDYVTINSEALKQIRWGTNYGKFGFIDHDEDGENHVYEQYLPANLEIPKFLVYPKVPMTEAEKKEFDKLKDEMSLDRHDLDDLLTRIKDSEDFPCLYHRLYVADGDGVESQLEFARAWADPSLIEVIPEKKWNVKVPISCDNAYYNKVINDCKDAVMVKHCVDKRSLQINNNFKFTAEEIKYYHLDNDLFEKVEVSE